MTGVTAAAPAPPRAALADADHALRAEVAALTERHARRWLATPADPPGPAELGPVFGRWARWRNRGRVDRLVRNLCRELVAAPPEGPARHAWERRLEERICAFGETCLAWPPHFRNTDFARRIFAASVDFVHRARELEAGTGFRLGPDELFQALRNAWIMNGLQVLLGRPVATTPAVFAYSMLYPLTDNLLDDPEVPAAHKTGFNRRLARRLAGERPAAGEVREEAVSRLVGEIETELPRARFPRVYASLLAIHRGQVRSLAQQAQAVEGADAPGCPAPDLLRLSAEKGGTSVLADGFLVAGDLAPEEACFLFGYGFALQLLDDLQDAAVDRAAGHRTLFSTAAGARPLDELTSRLARFTATVLAAGEEFDAPGWPLVLELIRRNCPLLLVQAVGEQRRLFTRSYVRRLERHSPVAFAAVPRLRRRAERRWAETESALRARHGGDAGEAGYPSVWPPSTVNTAPVVKSEAAEAR